MTVALDRIRFFVNKLADPRTKRSVRLECWRLISSAALDAHEREVQEVDSLNSLKADPALETSF